MTVQSPLTTGSEPLISAIEPAAGDTVASLAPEKKLKKDKGPKKPGSNRGIETLFRVTYENHIQLSQLADNKANMMISINGLIISVVIALVTPRLNSLTIMFAPALVLIVGSMLSLGFAITASRPRINRHPVTLDQIRNNEGNMLFFAQFVNMPMREFEEGMTLLMKDRRLLYDNLSREIYSMGKVLLKKYQHVQLAYTVFLAAMALSVILFVAVFLTFGILP